MALQILESYEKKCPDYSMSISFDMLANHEIFKPNQSPVACSVVKLLNCTMCELVWTYVID